MQSPPKLGSPFLLRGIAPEDDKVIREQAKMLGMGREIYIRHVLADLAHPRPETIAYLRSLFGDRVNEFFEDTENS